MQVRKAKLSDIPRLRVLAQMFNSAYYDIPLDFEKLETYLKTYIDHGVVLMTDDGAIVGTVVEDPLRDWTVLVELAWFAIGGSGIRLLKAFEQHGKDVGVDEIRLTTLETNTGVQTLLNRKGYTPIETSHRLLI